VAVKKVPVACTADRLLTTREVTLLRESDGHPNVVRYTDKKDKKNFLIYKEIQMGSVAKSYMRKGFLIYEEMRKNFDS
jgi:hypothetical protein